MFSDFSLLNCCLLFGLDLRVSSAWFRFESACCLKVCFLRILGFLLIPLVLIILKVLNLQKARIS